MYLSDIKITMQLPKFSIGHHEGGTKLSLKISYIQNIMTYSKKDFVDSLKQSWTKKNLMN